MIEQILGNWVCWAIFALALFCYQQLLLEFLLVQKARKKTSQGDIEAVQNSGVREELSGVLIGALPLLGLLGTIVGLLKCFAGIAIQGASSELVSGGIADALLTTQLGLICAIPGWILLAWVRSYRKRSDSYLTAPTSI